MNALKGFESFLLENVYKDPKIWSVCVPLICFPMVVWHQIDMVMLQFELFQDIPDSSHNLDKVHHTDMKGHSDINWVEEHQRWSHYMN